MLGWREALPAVFHSDLRSGASAESHRRPYEKKKHFPVLIYEVFTSIKHDSLNEDLPSSGFGDNVFCRNEIVAYEWKQ